MRMRNRLVKLVQVVGFGVLSQIDKSHLTMLLVRLYWIHTIWKEAKEGGKGGRVGSFEPISCIFNVRGGH